MTYLDNPVYVEDALEDIRRAMNDQVVVRHHGRAVTRGDLERLFDLVKDQDNWKNPIDRVARLSLEEAQDMAAAVAFFAGCAPEIFPMTRECDEIGCREYRVMAAGYYAAVGA
jgi:hypothetical protein